ncbi:MAG: glucose-6-phosphate isomerase, partial [Gammaproteobacteria bacterium]|nr:glucose-6-phosphate isomerase [Gammaproteobacteria bacterium]
LWSAAGLPIAIALGRGGFEDLLAGAHMVDEHFRETPLANNIPVLLALLAIWNTNFHGAATHAVLPYGRRLRLLPSYLQQLEMESNGKSVRRDGESVRTHTAPVVWGGEETNGQHAFHQLLLQGTRAFSADFVAVARAGHDLKDHHDWLIANCLAQSKAMLEGRVPDGPLAAHRSIPGGHPSTTLLLDELSPRSLGALLALYEHKVFCLGAIWQINAFDQWGVELGKELAGPIHDELAKVGGRGARHDASTAGLLTQMRRAR